MHHHLIRKGLRTSVGLVVETGEAREVHHFACLAGYGAEAINPYLAFETLDRLDARSELPEEIDDYEIAASAIIKSVDKGLLKVMSKMGISTFQSYCGAQIFDAVGLAHRCSSTSYFTGTASQIDGVGLAGDRRGELCAGIATPSATRRSTAAALDVGGEYASACAAKPMPGRRKRCR